MPQPCKATTDSIATHHSNESGIGSWRIERLPQFDMLCVPEELHGQCVTGHQNYACTQQIVPA